MSNYEQQDLFQTPKESTSLPAPTLVSRFPLQARKGAKKIQDTSGQKYIDSLEMTGFVQCTYLEKMLVDILDSVSTPYQRTWSAVVTDGGVLVSKHRVSARITEDKESGGSQKTRTMIPTATASDHIERESTSTETMNPMTGKSVSLDRFVKFWPTKEIQKSGKPQMWITPTTVQVKERSKESLNKRKEMRNKSGRKTVPPGSLEEQVKYGYPIQDMSEIEKPQMWPTPQHRDYKHGTTEGTMGRDSPNLDMVVGQSKATGSLNPTWVEWLMGFPIGYTDLRHSETQ